MIKRLPGGQRGVRGDIHRGWTTEGTGKVDTTRALVWHFNAEGKVDRVINLSGGQLQKDAYLWNSYTLAPIPERPATCTSISAPRWSDAHRLLAWPH